MKNFFSKVLALFSYIISCIKKKDDLDDITRIDIDINFANHIDNKEVKDYANGKRKRRENRHRQQEK